MAFSNSVCSYPNRGNYGKSSYRGNCTGHIIKDFCESYLPRNGLLVDPSIGGGTTVDVAKEMGIDFVGTDLSQGFNLLTDDLATYVGRQADAVWWHPPYWDMISYSGNMWGEPNQWDLSRMNLNDFTEAMVLAMMNIHDATKDGGVYGILMGNLRRKGNYYNLSAMVERVSAGKLVDEIIKIQHNCVSDNRSYNGKLVRIAHEKLMVFKKKAVALYFLTKTEKRLEITASITWKAAVRRLLQSNGNKQWQLKEIYEQMQPYADGRNNNNWQAKIRQVLQDDRFFIRIDTGVFTLKRDTAAHPQQSLGVA